MKSLRVCLLYTSAAKAQYKVDIDKKKIEIKEPLKTLGVHDVLVRVHPEITSTIKAVSYTHLDVYKRQVIYISKETPKNFSAWVFYNRQNSKIMYTISS